MNECTKIMYRNTAGHTAGRAVNSELRYRMEQALRYRCPAAILIDEAQHLTKIGSGKKLIDQLDCLKSLASQIGCVHVLIGTYELLPCRNLSAQLSRRSLDIHFPRYRVETPSDLTAFQRVVFSFQRHLPLEQEPELWPDWEYLYTHSVGCVGVLKDWFVRALNDALLEGAQTLSRKHLERHAWSVEQCEKMVQEVLEGEAELTEKPEARRRLRRLLGLSDTQIHKQTDSSNGTSPRPAASVGRVGRRKPVRDKVGE
jgi:AAA domain-containing protein